MTSNENTWKSNQPKDLGWIEESQSLAAFGVTTALFLLLHWIWGVTEFPWDAGGYWKLSAVGLLFDFPKEIRGYFYPALLSPARLLSDIAPSLAYVPYRIISSLTYAYVFTRLLPAFYVSVFGGSVNFWRRLIVPVLVFALFPGVIIYTLSDLPALALMLGAVVCSMRSEDSSTTARRYFFLCLGGFLAYGAYNTRTIFLFPLGLATVSLAAVIYRNHPVRVRIFVTVAFLIGVMLASTPQILINKKNYGELWPGVITTSSYNRSLFASQLLWGITLQRYETSIDKSSPGAGVFYLDKAGERLFTVNKIGNTPFEVPDYLMLVLRNPIEFVGIFGRHIVNGLDLRDGEVYTLGQPGKKNILAALNFLVVFSGLAIIGMAATVHRSAGQQGIVRFFWMFLMMLPVLAVIPGAIETRFFLAFHLAIYCAIAFSSDITAIRNALSRHLVLITLAFGVSALAFFSVSTTTMSNPQYAYSDLYRGMW